MKTVLFFTIRCQPPRESYFCLASSSIGPFCLVLKQFSSIAGLMLQYLHQHVAKALCFDGPSGNQKQMMWFNPHRYNTVAVSFRLDVYSASVWSFCRFWPLNCIRMCCFSRQTLDFFPWAELCRYHASQIYALMLKGTVSFTHSHVLQIWMDVFQMLSTKDVFKNDGKQTVDGSHSFT